MPRPPLIDRQRAKDAGTAHYLETGGLTVQNMIAIARALGGGIETGRAGALVKEIKEEADSVRADAANAGGGESPEDLRAQLSAEEQTAVQYLMQTMVSRQHRERTRLHQQGEQRLEDSRREHREALAVATAEREALQVEHDALQDALGHAEQQTRASQQRATDAEQALAHERAQMEQRQAAHHAEILGLTEQLAAATQGRDDATRATHETEQRLRSLEERLDRVREEMERERTRADDANQRAVTLAQRLEEARAGEMTTGQDLAALRAQVSGQSALIDRLARELDRRHAHTEAPQADARDQLDLLGAS